MSSCPKMIYIKKESCSAGFSAYGRSRKRQLPFRRSAILAEFFSFNRKRSFLLNENNTHHSFAAMPRSSHGIAGLCCRRMPKGQAQRPALWAYRQKTVYAAGRWLCSIYRFRGFCLCSPPGFTIFRQPFSNHSYTVPAVFSNTSCQRLHKNIVDFTFSVNSNVVTPFS